VGKTFSASQGMSKKSLKGRPKQLS